jgi:DNA invertase Pin-like site-specific DNA recombinase
MSLMTDYRCRFSVGARTFAWARTPKRLFPRPPLLEASPWLMATNSTDEFTNRMFEAINGMLLDMLAAVARKDYDDRRRRQAQGQAKAKAEGKYRGRPEDTKRNAGIACMLKANQSWNSIQSATGCSRRERVRVSRRGRYLKM